jgi:hypothetical protein
MDIRAWFGPWWPNFSVSTTSLQPHRRLTWTSRASGASVTAPRFFIAAAVDHPVVRGGEFDHVRTRLLIRPHFFEGLELLATKDSGAARGTFRLENDPTTRNWQSLDVDADSTMPFDLTRQVVGPVGENVLSAFATAEPPEAKVTLHFDSPTSPLGRHRRGHGGPPCTRRGISAGPVSPVRRVVPRDHQ